MNGGVPSFRLTAFVDGLEREAELVPKEDDGGFTLFIEQRDGIAVERTFEITGHREGDTLVIDVRNRNGLLVAQSRTSA